MPELTIQHRWWHGLVQRLAASSFGIWLLPKTLHRIDTPLLRLTGNRVSLTSWLAGLPVILLTTIGAKSGLPRQVPLVALVDQENLILIASSYGSQRNPAWYYNLIAHPIATIGYKGQQAEYRARQADSQERTQYWEMATALYPGFGKYRHRASHRKIPILVLEPALTPTR